MKKVEELIEENKNLIYKIASKYKNLASIEDMFQVGAIGLMKAYKNYRLNSSAEFTTYAYKYIMGEILEFIKCDRTMKVSPDAIKIYKSYEKTKDFLTNELGKVPSIEEISNFMGISKEYLNNILESVMFTVSLDAPLAEESYSLENVVGIDNSETVDNLIDLKRELENLSNEERELISLRYFKDYTQSETANILNMSQVQVSRSESAILRKIKTKIAA